MKLKILRKLLILLLLLLPVTACAELEAHFVDVGQGDCCILVCDGEAMIVDGGQAQASEIVYDYAVNHLGITDWKAVVATHPDNDHICGLIPLFDVCSVQTFIAPTMKALNANAYPQLLSRVEDENCAFIIPKWGETFPLGSAEVTMYPGNGSSANGKSIVLKIRYGDTSFLLTGDMDSENEKDILAMGIDVQADVLKVAHHGSSESSSFDFLRAVSPEYAVISVGKDNEYGHPTDTVIDRLITVGAAIHRTDFDGNIVFTSDGTALQIETIAARERKTVYIGNWKSKKLHYPDCGSVSDMMEWNKVEFTNREDAIAQGYVPCRRCDP